MTENKLSNTFTDNVQIVNKPTYTSRSLIDHIYINKILIKDSLVTYLSDLDALRVSYFFIKSNIIKQ